jgi:hypothetical protein
MTKSIEVIVMPDGSLKIDAVGFKGADCEKATAFLEKELGQIKVKRKKPEYYRQTQNQQQIGS